MGVTPMIRKQSGGTPDCHGREARRRGGGAKLLPPPGLKCAMGETQRSYAALVVWVELSEQVRTDSDQMVVGSGDQGHGVTGERASDQATSPPPPDPAARADSPGDCRGRIGPGWQTRRQATRTGAVARGGRSLPERFVRTLMVVVMPPVLRPKVLGGQSGGWWSGGLGLEHAMHLFVRSVVARHGGPGEAHLDAQLQPLHAQARQSQRALRRRMPGVKQVTGGGFAHGQRLVTPAVSGAEPALEVHRSHIVQSARRGEERRSRPQRDPPRLPPPGRQPEFQRARMRQTPPRPHLAKRPHDLPGSPTRPLQSYPLDRHADLLGDHPRVPMRPTRLLAQSLKPMPQKPPPPLVAGGPADVVHPTRLRETSLPSLDSGDELRT